MKSSEANVVRLQPPDAASRRSQLEFLPAALEIMETPASPAGRAIAATIILFLVVAVGWSIVGHIDIVAVAPGKVVPTGRTKTVQPLETGIVTAIAVKDGDRVAAGQVVMRLDQTVATAERNHVGHDLLVSKLDVARLAALRAGLDTGSDPDASFAPPGEAPAAQIVRTRATMIEQASAQENKVAAFDQQIAQKVAEAEEIAATIAKLEASLPFLAEEADVRRKALAIEFGNKIAHLDAQIRLADQKSELTVQQRKAAENSAARKALERQRAQAAEIRIRQQDPERSGRRRAEGRGLHRGCHPRRSEAGAANASGSGGRYGPAACGPLGRRGGDPGAAGDDDRADGQPH